MNTPSPKPARAELVLRTAKKRQALALGQELSVGRDPSCRLRLKKSPGPSRLFRVFAHQSSYRLEVFEGADVSLDGEACDQAELADGSIIRAANLSFEVRLPAAAPTANLKPGGRLALAAAGSLAALMITGALLWPISSPASSAPEVAGAEAPDLPSPELRVAEPGSDSTESRTDASDPEPSSIAAAPSPTPETEPAQAEALAKPEPPAPEAPEALVAPAPEDPGQTKPALDAPEEPGPDPSQAESAPQGMPEQGNDSDPAKPAAPPAPDPAALAAAAMTGLLEKAQALARSKRYEDAITLLEGARAATDAPQLARLEAALAKLGELAWPARKARIAKQWSAREAWLDAGLEGQELAAYLSHAQWSFRAIGAVGLAARSDPRSLASIRPALTDKSMLVRAFALKGLLKVPVARLKACADGLELCRALVEGYGRSKKEGPYRKQVLARLSGEKHKTRRAWQRWLDAHSADFVPALTPPFDLSAFSADDLKRYQRELKAKRIKAGGMKTVLRGEAFKSAIEELRKNGLEVAICLDVTGSMGGVLKESQERIESLSTILSSLIGKFRIGLVSYRDAVATTVPLTKNWRGFKKALDQQRASAGGDGPEGVEKAVEVALGKMGWKKRAKKAIVIIADAPPHKEDLKRFEQLAHASKRLGVTIHGLYPRALVPDIDRYVKITGGKSATMASDTEFLKSFLLLIFGEELEPYLKAFLDIYLDIMRDAKAP